MDPGQFIANATRNRGAVGKLPWTGTSSLVCVLCAKATTTPSANEYTTATSKAQAMWRDSFAQTFRVLHREPDRPAVAFHRRRGAMHRSLQAEAGVPGRPRLALGSCLVTAPLRREEWTMC